MLQRFCVLQNGGILISHPTKSMPHLFSLLLFWKRVFKWLCKCILVKKNGFKISKLDFGLVRIALVTSILRFNICPLFCWTRLGLMDKRTNWRIEWPRDDTTPEKHGWLAKWCTLASFDCLIGLFIISLLLQVCNILLIKMFQSQRDQKILTQITVNSYMHYYKSTGLLETKSLTFKSGELS